MTGKDIITESKLDEAYILCMMYGTETQIYGIFTDKRLLLDSYNILLAEDGRCALTEEHPEKPIIYKMPVNCFVAWKTQWCSTDTSIFYDKVEEYKVSIEDVCRRIKIAEFYGYGVYCDLNFGNGPFFEVDYLGGDTSYSGRINIELAEVCGDFDRCVKPVLDNWLDDHKDILLEIWKTKKLLEIPKWDED